MGKLDSQLKTQEQNTGSLITFFDHARYPALPPARSRAGLMHTSMYRGNLALEHEGDEYAFAQDVYAIAAEHGLKARVDHTDDITYLSDTPGPPTLPVVWWNPTRIDLENLEKSLFA